MNARINWQMKLYIVAARVISCFLFIVIAIQIIYTILSRIEKH